MLSVIVPIVLIGLVALGPIVWRVWHDRRVERALDVRADVAAAVRRALGGESLVSIQVNAPRALRSGRIILSVPGGWEWLIQEAWPRIVAHVPRNYDLVVRAGAPSPSPASRPADVLRRAA
jgi:hypothetical protein